MHAPFRPTPVNRRDVLRRSALGLGALGLGTLLNDEGCRVGNAAESASSSPLDVRAPHFPGRAKRVIHFFLNGGPSHVDTFDGKPALAKYAGQPLGETLRTERKTGAAFPSPFKFQPFGESGIEVSEVFARTARHIDDIAVIRSMYAEVPNHEPSLMLMNAGDSIQPRPSVGSWVLYGLGTENANLPGYVVLCPGRPVRFSVLWNSSFLPSAYQGTYINHSEIKPTKMIPHLRNTQ